MYGRTAALFATTMLAFCAAAPAWAVDVLDLSNEFNANGLAFRQKFVGKRVTVTGNAWVIDGEVTPGYVSLSAPDRIGGLLICTVTDKSRLVRLSKGRPVTVSGTVQGFNSAGIQLKPCDVE